MKRFHVCDNGYKYDRLIFWAMIIISMSFISYIAYESDFNLEPQFYLKCEEDICKNPLADPNSKFYNTITGLEMKNKCTDNWCKKEYVFRGEYGKPPPTYFKYFNLILITLVLCGLVLNHLIHNRGVRPSLKLNLPDFMIKKLNKFLKYFEEDAEE